MSDKIKYGETYESLAEHLEPYLYDRPTSPTQVYNTTAYPLWWDKTITVYNKYEDPITQMVVWHRHILSNCFVKTTSTMITGGQITYNTSNNIVRIPQQSNFKIYSDWVETPNVEQFKYLTLHQGDILVLKAVDDVIDEYTQGIRSTDLLTKYKALDLCLTLDNWQDNTGNGRVCPHYFVSGE